MTGFLDGPGSTDLWLLVLAGTVLVLVGLAAFRLLQMARAKDGLARTVWLGAAAAAAGVGCWATYVVAILAATPTDATQHNVSHPVQALTIAAITLVAAAVTWLGIAADKRSRRSANERYMQLEAAIQADLHGFAMFGSDGRLQLWNERLLEIYMIPPGQAIAGCTFMEALAIAHLSGNIISDRRQFAELQSAIASGSPASLSFELQDGRHIKVDHRPMANGGWLSKHEDVTDHRQAEARFAYLALHDLATGLPNRAALNQRIAESLSLAAEQNASFAVIRLGIDKFKEINDVFGQSAGDAVLAAMAKRLAEICHWGFLARPGGDEFSIVTTPQQGTDSAQQICEQLAAICDSEFDVDGQVIRVGCTGGVSLFPRDGNDIETLIAHADTALYRAKLDKRGTVCLFEASMDLQIRERRALQRELAVALKNDEFEIYYQPQATAQGEIVGFEALLRWHHPVRGMVSPAIFIPLAEETGLIGAIDEWVLRSVCAEAASWSKPLGVAINFSPLDFRRTDVPALILAVLFETGLAPARLEVEITEGVLIDDFAGAVAILRRIQNLGVRVAMDDFGAGYSSLSYLQSFPFDKIKIDQAFISELETNADSAAIVKAVLGLGHTLDLPVIAEGVETPGQLDFLARAGCNEVQGYLIGRPQPIAHYRAVTSGGPEAIERVMAGARFG
ncbi:MULTISPECIES: EAL domain-containing protein [Rhodopseudomonas]|uniref:putative bifunctional diguanylate cyclase/phosphodiesterase n=1 Tax=Rhodopseudomonas TaxID=1073 RepID=UPI0006961904|nr:MULTISPECIES: EAL domain-containing protein [Rhodopseudomonas]MDF3813806.1 EAL domain-containing protein [Rhodopseudomonas sp. BAL398]WOK19675.1 EAL domain-containing protein [Rhodopseudomonas sp. BAL398]